MGTTGGLKRYLPFIIIGGVLLAALAGGGLLLRARQQAQPLAKAAPGSPGAHPPHTRGSTRAAVSIEEFGDFQCQPCSILWPILQKIERAYGDRVSLTFRHRPLPQHRNAPEAARAAEAAGLQGRFWEMHDALYRNRAAWVNSSSVRSAFEAYATELGLNVEQFMRDLDSDIVRRRLDADRERGDSLKIDRTPVIFVNGELMPFSSSPEDDLRKAIDAALAAPAE